MREDLKTYWNEIQQKLETYSTNENENTVKTKKQLCDMYKNTEYKNISSEIVAAVEDNKNLKKDTVEKKWSEILWWLEKIYCINRIIIDAWIKPLEVSKVVGKTVYLCTQPGIYAEEYLKAKGYDSFVEMAVCDVMHDSNINVVILSTETCCVK